MGDGEKYVMDNGRPNPRGVWPYEKFMEYYYPLK